MPSKFYARPDRFLITSQILVGANNRALSGTASSSSFAKRPSRLAQFGMFTFNRVALCFLFTRLCIDMIFHPSMTRLRELSVLLIPPGLTPPLIFVVAAATSGTPLCYFLSGSGQPGIHPPAVSELLSHPVSVPVALSPVVSKYFRARARDRF